jgi:hypothetical protein
VVVIWAYSVALVWLVWFVSKRFKQNNHDYHQASQKAWLSKGLIIKPRSLSVSVWLSNALLIKPKNPTMQHNQINQYSKKSLISFLAPASISRILALLAGANTPLMVLWDQTSQLSIRYANYGTKLLNLVSLLLRLSGLPMKHQAETLILPKFLLICSLKIAKFVSGECSVKRRFLRGFSLSHFPLFFLLLVFLLFSPLSLFSQR